MDFGTHGAGVLRSMEPIPHGYRGATVYNHLNRCRKGISRLMAIPDKNYLKCQNSLSGLTGSLLELICS